MPALLLKILKGLAVHFATKYAAELLLKATIEALEKAASKSTTEVDDILVAKVKADREELINIISGKG